LDADAFAHTLAGVTHAQAGDRTGARQAFEAALELQPEYPAALRELGAVLRIQGDNDGAIALYERALAVAPDDPIAEHDLGLAFAWAGRYDVARGHYENAVHLDPDFASAVHNLGVSLLQLGRPAEARAQFVRALELDPGSEVTQAAILYGPDGLQRDADDPEAVANLVAAIETGDARTRTKAVELLARASGPGPAVLRLLVHREAMVRVAAAGFFRKQYFAGAVGRLTELLERDPDYAVRTEAALALRPAAGPRASEALVRAVSADPAVNVRKASAQALARHPGCVTARALRAAQRDRIIVVRRIASESVAFRGGGAAPVDPSAPDAWLARVCAGESAPLP
jgi:Flp pilus assembly protein TadD